MNDVVLARLDQLPTSPGVYLMKDRAGEVVYVGKAVNLRSRVRSYFTRGGDERAFIPLLEGLLGDIETILVTSEKEALLLENELIKQHRPRFNVMLRDDKSFICLRLSSTHPYPRLEVVRAGSVKKEERASPATGGARRGGASREERASPATGGVRRGGASKEERASPATGGVRRGGASREERASPATGGARRGGASKDGARYFGPYSSAGAIRETLRVVNRHFQLRTCSDHVLDNRSRPCLQYQIHRCPAPCVFDIPSAEYKKSVDEVALFLEGKGAELKNALSTRMRDAAGNERFEEAARVRDQLHALDRSLEKQRVSSADDVLDQDVLGVYREGAILEVQILFVRGGRLLGGRPFSFNKQEFPTGEILRSFLDQYYSGAFVPKEVLLPEPLGAPEEAEAIETWLSEQKGERVRLLVPERGDKRRLVEMAAENAKQRFEERQRNKANAEQTLERLQKKLRLEKLPRRIECYDISNISGTITVASQVAFTDGEPDKARYRHYKVKTVEGSNDFASMLEVLTRRLTRGVESGDLPDLLLIDGGKGQLNVAREAVRLTGAQVELAAIAKSRVIEDEALFAERQGFAVSEAWAEGEGARAPAGEDATGVQTVQQVQDVPNVQNVQTVQPAAPEADGRSRVKGRWKKASIERSPERVFLPGQKNPVVLRQNTSELFLLQRLRDEAHRFAITFHRKLRNKKSLRSVLEDVPGVGGKRKRALLRAFGSLKKVREASAAQIAEVGGFNVTLAERVKAFLATPVPSAAPERVDVAENAAESEIAALESAAEAPAAADAAPR